MNNNHIVVLDFETGSVDPKTCQITEIGACIIHPRTLDISDEFDSECCPQDINNKETLSDESLKITNKTRENLINKPPLEEVWKNFRQYLKQYSGKTKWERPVMAGYNIRNFDKIITDRLCKEFGDTDKDGNPNLFSDFIYLDLMDTIWLLTENSNAFVKYSDTGKHNIQFTTVCKYLGLDTANAHNALVDVRREARVIVRFIKMYRHLLNRVPMEGAFLNEKV